MAQNVKATRISVAYGELKKFIENASYSKIIKTANKIISDDQKQVEAWQCKVVACIQSDLLSDAVITINRAPNKKDLQFELAYCKYRLNDVPGAFEVLSAATDRDSPRGKELMAQIHYKLEQYENCYDIYRDLVRSTDDDFDVERSANMAAAQAQQTLHKQCEMPSAPKQDASYEQWYNSGCAALAADNKDEAAMRLDKSMSKCAELLEEEGAGEEEIQQEQAIIRVQKAFTLQLQGKEKEAIEIYNSVLQHKVTDSALIAILHNNIAATSIRDGSVLDVRKKMKTTTQVPDLVHKLTSMQSDQLTLNNCILTYQSQQSFQEDRRLIEDCARLIESPTTFTPVKLNALLVLSASLAKSGKINDAVDRLHDWAKSNPKYTMLITLAATQLKLMKSDVTSAIAELSSLPPNDRYKPGVVGALVTLLSNKKQKSSVTKLLDDAVKYHSKNKDCDLRALENLLRRASDLQMKEGCPEAAAAALEQLRLTNPETSSACIGSLINAYSQFNKAKALELSRTLPDLNTDELDVDALEASLGPKYVQKTVLKENVTEKTEGISGRVKPRKKKKRKIILPKNYIEGVQPDPERWLPRWQRKTGGGKRRKDRKKDRNVGKGTQGGTGDAADKYDITKNPNQFKSSSTSQQPSEPRGPKRNMPKKKTVKKK